MKKRSSGWILIVIFLLGLCLLLYPTVSNYLAEKNQSKAIVAYQQTLQHLNNDQFVSLFAKADDYNRALHQLSYPLLHYDTLSDYHAALNVKGDGMMGYVSIEKLDVSLPIYHGTDEVTLNRAAGHIEGSSLPTGEPDTHTVLSAHRGLPGAKLFTNLDRMEEGDTFTVTVLDRVLTYEVDQILVVKPEETDDLRIIQGGAYCTLLTCTPYGINTHRLLVRGHRVETAKTNSTRIVADASQIDPYIVAPLVATPMLIGLFTVILIGDYRKNKRKRSKFKG